MSNILDIEHLKVDYKVREGYLSAVNDVSVSVGEGEVLALVGESGCGKSTLALCIMRLLMEGNEKIEGKILYNGETEILTLPSREMEKLRGKEIGMIFQDPLDSLNPVYKVGNQVKEALKIDGMSDKKANEEVLRLFKEVKIPDPEQRIHSYPHELSGGMRQRVMIAMMLARKPKLLIADEPTTALDVTVEAQILRIMRDLCRKQHSSIILITHNFGIVAEIADRIGIMYAGEIVELGNIYEIFKNPIHPYSEALLQSLPNCTKKEGRISIIEGTVPRIINEFKGCRFQNRCPYASDKCRIETPPVRQYGSNHFVRCHKEVQQ